MKLISFSIIFIFSNALFSQTSIGIVNQDYYVYNNLKDTIHLGKIHDGWVLPCDNLKIIDTIQIDGVGAKEIIFFRKCHVFAGGHGGTFDIEESIEISKYEIWNLATKQMIFDAINFYKSNYERFVARSIPSRVKGFETYSYDFNIDSTGKITISNLKTTVKAYTFKSKTIKKKRKIETVVEEVPYSYDFTSDKPIGTYKYLGGKYVRE